jgi:hypothetical protein
VIGWQNNNNNTINSIQRRPLQYALQRFQAVSGIPNSPKESQRVLYAERYEESLIHEYIYFCAHFVYCLLLHSTTFWYISSVMK